MVLNPKIVLLMPSFEEVKKRNETRQRYITDQEIVALYKSQADLTGYDEKIDNTKLSAEEVANRL